MTEGTLLSSKLEEIKCQIYNPAARPSDDAHETLPQDALDLDFHVEDDHLLDNECYENCTMNHHFASIVANALTASVN